MQQAFAKAPDCLAMVVAPLSPLELQRLRCVSKDLYREITKEMMLQCIENTIARYAGPHAMPDGAVRFYSTFGQSRYDICKVQGGYQLEQEGFQTQNYDMGSGGENFEIKLDTLLGDRNSRMTSIHKFADNMHEKTIFGFEVKTNDTNTLRTLARFTFKQPAGSPAPTRGERNSIFLRDLQFYRRRLNENLPTLL
jgi:hypothetical protein